MCTYSGIFRDTVNIKPTQIIYVYWDDNNKKATWGSLAFETQMPSSFPCIIIKHVCRSPRCGLDTTYT